MSRILLENATCLDEQMRFRRADVLVDGNRISSLSPPGSLGNGEASETLDCSEMLVIPGLVNAHYHSQASLGRGLFRGMPISEWGEESSEQGKLQARFFDLVDSGLSAEEMKTVCRKAYSELVRMGITFTQDSGLGEPPGVERLLAEAMNEVGIRGIVDAYDEIERLHDRPDGLVAFGGHLPEEEDITDETLADAARQRKACPDVTFMTHCLETKWRREAVLENYGCSSVRLFAERGLLDGRTVLFHGVEMGDEDIRILAEHGASLAHCPVSNLAAVAPVPRCLEMGVEVGLGTDFGSADIWEVMRVAHYLRKGRPDELDAETVFRMATIGGARAYGMEEYIGKIAEGHAADLVLIDGSGTGLLPIVELDSFTNRLHNLLMECRPHMIQGVMVAGEWVVEDGRLAKVDEEELDADYAAIARRVG
ncbi:MAG: amidohydrolase family protein [Actinomycetota bacterium]